MQLAIETGGAWPEAEAAHVLGVSVQELRAWQRDRRVLAFDDDSRCMVHPAIQYMPNRAGAAAILPGLDRVLATIGDYLQPQEIFGLLASHQVWLATGTERARTGFAALAHGDADRVVEMARYVVTPADLGAPPIRATGDDPEDLRQEAERDFARVREMLERQYKRMGRPMLAKTHVDNERAKDEDSAQGERR